VKKVNCPFFAMRAHRFICKSFLPSNMEEQNPMKSVKNKMYFRELSQLPLEQLKLYRSFIDILIAEGEE